MSSILFTLVNERLERRTGKGFHSTVNELLEAQQGWRRIAEAITTETGISISHETARQWHIH